MRELKTAIVVAALLLGTLGQAKADVCLHVNHIDLTVRLVTTKHAIKSATSPIIVPAYLYERGVPPAGSAMASLYRNKNTIEMVLTYAYSPAEDEINLSYIGVTHLQLFYPSLYGGAGFADAGEVREQVCPPIPY